MCAVCTEHSHKLDHVRYPTDCSTLTDILSLGLVSFCFAAVPPLLAVVSALWLPLYLRPTPALAALSLCTPWIADRMCHPSHCARRGGCISASSIVQSRLRTDQLILSQTIKRLGLQPCWTFSWHGKGERILRDSLTLACGQLLPKGKGYEARWQWLNAYPEHLIIAHVLLNAKDLLGLFHCHLPRSCGSFEGLLSDPLPLRICTSFKGPFDG